MSIHRSIFLILTILLGPLMAEVVPVIADSETPKESTASVDLVPEEVVDPLTSKPEERDEAVRLQIFLDQSLFGPGFIDGKPGNFTTKAVYAYNRAHGRDPGDWKAIREEALASVKEVYATAIVPEAASNYVNRKLPKSRKLQAKEKQMSYRSYAEFMAERYHTSEDFLIELNSSKEVWGLQPRDAIIVPNVDPFLIEEFEAGRFLKEDEVLSDRTVIIDTNWNQLYVYGPGEPLAVASSQSALIVVEEEEEEEAHQRLLAMFPITPGREQFIHHGEWKVVNCVEFPQWSYDDSFLKTGKRSKDKSKILRIPGGPNNPVGVIWSGLSKSGIGIHGTSSPRTIGRSVSAGCIRLSNWDAARFPKLVRPGAKAIIR